MSVSVLSAYQRLRAAEVDYLVKSGWERVGATQWARRGWAQVKQEDAVRLQKQHDHSPPEPQTIPSTSHWDGRPGHTRRLVVEVTDKGAVHYEQVTDEDAHQLLGAQTALELGLKEANTQRERGDALMREVENQERRVAELEEEASSLEKQLLNRDKQLSDTVFELATERTQGRQERHLLKSQLQEATAALEKVREHNRDIERTYDERMTKLDAEHSAVRGQLYQERKELVAQLSEAKVELEKSRAFNKNREAEHAAASAKLVELHREVCLERNKLRILNRDLAAEVDRYKSRRNELLAQLGESEKNEAALRDQLKEQLKNVAELRAQLIERATPEFMQHHMTLTRQVANLQSECHDLRQRNMTLAGDMSVVRNSLDQANSELREAQESLRRMEEDKSATVQLLKQSLERILNRMADMASVKRERR